MPTGSRDMLVIIPTYNEAGAIGGLLKDILNECPQTDILVVDDASGDGTKIVVEKLASGDQRVILLNRSGKSGLGSAYKAGIAYALSRQPPYGKIVQMDGDGSHSPDSLPALLSQQDECGIAIGSRYVPGASITHWHPVRQLISRWGNVCIRAFLGKPPLDWTSGYRCFSRKALAGVDLNRIRANGYFFQVELLHACIRGGCRCREVAIVFSGRRKGRSKLRTADLWDSFWGVLRLRFN